MRVNRHMPNRYLAKVHDPDVTTAWGKKEFLVKQNFGTHLFFNNTMILAIINNYNDLFGL